MSDIKRLINCAFLYMYLGNLVRCIHTYARIQAEIYLSLYRESVLVRGERKREGGKERESPRVSQVSFQSKLINMRLVIPPPSLFFHRIIVPFSRRRSDWKFSLTPEDSPTPSMRVFILNWCFTRETALRRTPNSHARNTSTMFSRADFWRVMDVRIDDGHCERRMEDFFFFIGNVGHQRRRILIPFKPLKNGKTVFSPCNKYFNIFSPRQFRG